MAINGNIINCASYTMAYRQFVVMDLRRTFILGLHVPVILQDGSVVTEENGFH